MGNQVEEALLRAVEAMRENLGEQIRTDDLARAAIFSKFYFCRVFHRVTGLSPGHFLSAIRIEEAKRLLTTTTMSVTEISHRVGYSSVGSFSTRFASSVGVPPSIYRQRGGGIPRLSDGDREMRSGEQGVALRGKVWSPRGDHPVFLGLFSDRILEGRPMGYTMLDKPGPYALENVPPGAWHLMATSVAPGQGEYIGCHGPIVIRPTRRVQLADIHLRPMRPLDPPMLLALPQSETGELALSAV
jgi:AraC family transcriptional regulator